MKSLKAIVNLFGRRENITMMEFRSAPGEAVLQASMGKRLGITKNDVVVAQLGPVENDRIEVLSDGSMIGGRPLTLGLDLGDHY